MDYFSNLGEIYSLKKDDDIYSTGSYPTDLGELYSSIGEKNLLDDFLMVNDNFRSKENNIIYELSLGKFNLKICKEINSKQICYHNKKRADCYKCTPFPRGKSTCKICNPCPHGKIKYNCKICNACIHKKLKYTCKICNACIHKKLKYNCKICKIHKS
jgi:hypothetical protein